MKDKKNRIKQLMILRNLMIILFCAVIAILVGIQLFFPKALLPLWTWLFAD